LGRVLQRPPVELFGHERFVGADSQSRGLNRLDQSIQQAHLFLLYGLFGVDGFLIAILRRTRRSQQQRQRQQQHAGCNQ
jgi:hypothetical protein